METQQQPKNAALSATAHNHVKIVVAEGKVTLEELHRALDQAIKHVVPKGGCNCGLTGFDLTFLRGDPELSHQLAGIPNVSAGLVVHG